MEPSVSSGRITDKCGLERILKKVVLAHRKYYAGNGMKNIERTTEVSEYPVNRPRIELDSSRVQAYSAVVLKLLVFATHFGYSLFCHGAVKIT
jgi:hypothetical protein